jgi:hypothetical protein
VEDDPPASPEASVASTATLTQVPTLSKPPPPPVHSSARPPPVVSECILNASILHQRRHFQVVSDFILSLPLSHTRRALGIRRLDVGMADLVIVDIPENQPVPNVSDPTFSVPSWNALDPDFLGELFDFANELSPSFIQMSMVTSGRAFKTTSLLLGSLSSRSGWESTVFAYIQLSIWTRPPTSFKFYYLFVLLKQLDQTLISGPDTRHFAFAMPMSSRLLALSSRWMMSL